MTIYEEYSKAKQQITFLTAKVKELEPKIYDEIKGLSEPMRTEEGLFTVVKRVVYRFTEKVSVAEKKMKEEVKNMKAEEIESGKAKSEEISGVRFVPKK